MKRIKFEYVFSMALLAVLTAALFIFRSDAQMTNLIVGALVAAFGSVSAYFFTKYNSGDNKGGSDEE